MAGLLANRWVIITGASSGFGAAMAVEFGKAGAHLLLGARRVSLLKKTASAAQRAGAASAQFQRLDVAETRSVNAFVQWAHTISPQIDVLINNAGGALGLDEVAAGLDSDWEAMIQSNVLGVLRMCRATIPHLRRPGGSIINIGSIAGHTAYEGAAVYCAAKAAERSITQALRLELYTAGIRVGTIDPGMAQTNFSAVRFKGNTARAAQVYAGVEPLSAQDVAEAAVWVASRPAHVCIDELLIKCTDQAAIHKVHRRAEPRPKRP